MPVIEKALIPQQNEPISGTQSLDMAALLLSAYELGDWINQSAEVAEYLYWKSAVAEDETVKQLTYKFTKAKELFDECQRFGRFHPNYHEAKDKVKEIERELELVECVLKFKQAEQVVDDMLHQVSLTIAESVSDTIKVPSNEKPGGGCGSGGSCGCGSGGCG